MIHPSELRRRRQRCRPLVAALAAAPWETQRACNACGSISPAVLAVADRYGIPVRTGLCRDCGLVYLLERLTPEGYGEFYARGTYRELTTRFKGRRNDLRQVRAGQVSYAERLGRTLAPFLAPPAEARLLDIGASTGLVAEQLCARHGYRATLLDPAGGEIEAAEAPFLRRVATSFETWPGDGAYDLILLCRTLEHLLDLRSSLVKVRQLLAPEGLFFCDLADWVEICRQEGPMEVVSRLDHCFWLCPETAQVLFRRLGFAVVAVLALPPFDQVGFLLRRGEPEPAAELSGEWLDERLRGLREIGSDWAAAGRKPLDAADRLRRWAARIRNRLLRR